MNNLVKTSNHTELIKQELEHDPRLRSVHTKDNYSRALSKFETWRFGRTFNKTLVEKYATVLQQEYKSATVNQHLAAIRWWARRLSDLAHDSNIPADQRDDYIRHTARIASVGDVNGSTVEPGREIGPGELSALITACTKDNSPVDVRDGAILALAALTGMRRAEIIGANYEDLSNDNGDCVLVVKGKGDKERKAYIYNGAALALDDWLSIRGDDHGPLFCTIERWSHELQYTKLDNGEFQFTRLGREGMRKMLKKRCKQAGVNGITWHDFRRTFAGNLLDEGIDLVTVQKLMGHSSPITTGRYDRRDERVRKQAVQKLFIPYSRSKKAAHKNTSKMLDL
jgi:integrase